MNKLIKNWSYLLLSDISQAIISFFVFMTLAVKLSPNGYGTLNSLLATASIIAVFATNINSNIVLTREFTLQPKTSLGIFKVVFPLRLYTVVIALVALKTFMVFDEASQSEYLFPVMLIVFSTILWDLAESVAFGHFVTKLTTIISIAGSFVWLLIVLLLPSMNVHTCFVIWAYACLFFSRAIVYLVLSYLKFVKNNRDETSLNSKTILIMSMPFLWMRIIGTFGDQIPILLLSKSSGVKEVAYYAVGNRFVMPITIAVTTGLRAVFPFMTKLFNEDVEDFKRKLISGFTIIFLLGGTIAAILTISSKFWLPTLFGATYSDAINAFNYQAWFGVLLCFDLLLSTVLSSTYRQKTLAIITTMDVLVIFPMMYYGSTFGAEGMAIAKLIGTLLIVTYHVIIVVRVLKIKLDNLQFYIAGFYFLMLMCISIFISYLPYKILANTIAFVFLGILKKSELKAIVLNGFNRFFNQLIK